MGNINIYSMNKNDFDLTEQTNKMVATLRNSGHFNDAKNDAEMLFLNTIFASEQFAESISELFEKLEITLFKKGLNVHVRFNDGTSIKLNKSAELLLLYQEMYRRGER